MITEKEYCFTAGWFTSNKKYGAVDLIYVDPPYPGTMNKYDEFYGAFDKIYNKSIEHSNLTSSSSFLFI